MTFVFAIRLKEHAPILEKDGSVMFSGKPEKIRLTYTNDKKTADLFADNVRRTASPDIWKIWVE